MIRTNENVKERIRRRIQQIDEYLLTHPLIGNPLAEELIRERNILLNKIKWL